MGVNSKFYISENRPDIIEILQIFKTVGVEFDDVSSSPCKKFNRDGSLECEYEYYRLLSKSSDFWVNYYPYSETYGGVRDGIDEATLYSSVDEKSIEILKNVGRYLGGTLCSNDSLDEDYYIYISKENSVDKVDELKKFIFKNTRYKSGLEIYKFIKENKIELLEILNNL